MERYRTECTTSKVYILEKDKKLPIYLELAPQRTFGINGIWPFDDKYKSLDKLEDFQLTYPTTSLQIMGDKCTDEEHKTIHVFNNMFERTVEALKRFCKVPKKQRKVPSPTHNVYRKAKVDNENKRLLNNEYNE